MAITQHRNGHEPVLHVLEQMLNPDLLSTIRQRIEDSVERLTSPNHLDAAVAARLALPLKHSLDILLDVATNAEHDLRRRRFWHVGWPPSEDVLDTYLTGLIQAGRSLVGSCHIDRQQSSTPTVWSDAADLHTQLDAVAVAPLGEIAERVLRKSQSTAQIATGVERVLKAAVLIAGVAADPDRMEIAREEAARLGLHVTWTGELLRHLLNN